MSTQNLDLFAEALQAYFREVCIALQAEVVKQNLAISWAQGRPLWKIPAVQDAFRRVGRGLLDGPQASAAFEAAAVAEDRYGVLLLDGAGGVQREAAHKKACFQMFALPNMTVRFLSLLERPEFDAQRFTLFYEQLLAELLGPIRYQRLSPMLGIKLNPNQRVVLPPSLVLRQPTQDEVDDWIAAPFEPLAPIDHLQQLGAIIEGTYDRDAKGAVVDGEELVLDLLRLLVGRRVTVTGTEHRSVQCFVGNRHFGRRSYLHSPADMPHQSVLVDEASCEQLQRYWKGATHGPNARMLAMPVRRWARALERTHPEDRLIDYWIALESLFCEGSKGELAYRAALRIAAFLGDGPEARLAIFRTVKKSYNLRSELVHGSKHMLLAKDHELVQQTGDLAKRVLTQLLVSDTVFKRDDLELALLAGDALGGTSGGPEE